MLALLHLRLRENRLADPRDSYRALFCEHFRFVCASLRRLGVRTSDVEDAAQEVFVIVHRRQNDIDPSRSLRPWLFGICLNVARALHRKSRRRKESGAEVSPDLRDRGPLPDEQLALLEDHSLLIEALDSLDFDRGAVFVMHTLSECTAAEIAETLSLPINTVYPRLRIAREEFDRAIHRLRLARGDRLRSNR